MKSRAVWGWARWRQEGPYHALREDGGSWCGLDGPTPPYPGPVPEDIRICRNCARVLVAGGRRGLDLYTVYTVSDPGRWDRLPHVSLQPPGRGWREDRLSQYRIRVRAHTQRQALYLAAHGIEAAGPGEVGIVEILQPRPDAWEV